jgi:hypothetical protein
MKLKGRKPTRVINEKKISVKARREFFGERRKYKFARQCVAYKKIPDSAIGELVDDLYEWYSRGRSLLRYAKTAGVAVGWLQHTLNLKLNAKQLEYLETARQNGLNSIADEILDIVDAVEVNEEQTKLQKAKLQTDNRKWLLERLSPQYSPTKRNENVSVKYVVVKDDKEKQTLENIITQVIGEPSADDNGNGADTNTKQ